MSCQPWASVSQRGIKQETKLGLIKQSIRKNKYKSNYNYYNENKIMKELEIDLGVYLGMRNQK